MQIKSQTYIDCLSDLEGFSLPAVDQQISHSLVVDLHVRDSEKELLLWTLKEQRSHCLESTKPHRASGCFQTRSLFYIFNGLEDILHCHRYDSRNVVAPHHGEGLPGGCLPICKYCS